MRFVAPLPPAEPDRITEAWRRYVADGTVDRGVVRSHVAAAWQRSRDAGCDPRRAAADVLSPADTAALLARESRLLEISAPFLAALSRAAGGERHAAMLGDGDGRVLEIVGDAATVGDENFPRAGSLLSETTAGANGIGTALAENGYVELVGPEHYIEGFHVFTCQGVPLLGPTAEPRGVLSMSVRRVETAARVRDILFCASEAAECELLSAWLADAVAGSENLQQRLDLLRQDLVQRIASVRLQLEVAARRIATGGDSSLVLEAAQQLTRKFRRQAAVWRDLAEHTPRLPERIELGELLESFVGLLETEARIAAVRIVLDRVERIAVLEDPRALSQRLLAAFLDAIQSAAPGSQVGVDAWSDGAQANVRVRATSRAGKSLAFAVDATLLH